MLPAIREVYRTKIAEVTKDDSEAKIKELKRQSSELREEEARLGRLYISGKIGEETYDRLRKEWQEKLRNVEISIADLERESKIHLDDLQVALMLMTKISHLYSRLDEKDRAQLLQIVVRRIIVNAQGEIVNHELHSPFAYLRELVDGLQSTYMEPRGSEQLLFGALLKPLSHVERFLCLIRLARRGTAHYFTDEMWEILIPRTTRGTKRRKSTAQDRLLRCPSISQKSFEMFQNRSGPCKKRRVNLRRSQPAGLAMTSAPIDSHPNFLKRN